MAINILLEGYAAGRVTIAQIAKIIADEWRNSAELDEIKTAKAYFEPHYSINSKKFDRIREISLKRRTVVIDGKIITNDKMSNLQIGSNFLRQSVTQKVNYAMGKPPVLSVSGDNARLDEYKALWQEFLNSENTALFECVRQAINNGYEAVNIIAAENKNIKLIRVAADTCCPQWSDEAETVLDAVVLTYTMDYYTGIVKTVLHKVEFWDKNERYRFIDNGTLIPDYTIGEAESYIAPILSENQAWGRVPFAVLRANNDKIPLLNLVKPYLDAYDKIISKTADSVIDDIDPVLVLKNISPEIGELSKARELLQNYRVISVEENGGADYVKVNSDVSSAKTVLDILYNDMQKSTQTVDLGDNASARTATEIKMMYSALDEYTSELERNFNNFINDIKYFFDMNLYLNHGWNFEEISAFNVNIKFNRDMIVDEAGAIDEVLKMHGHVSQETLDNWNPMIESHEVEKMRREAEQAQKENYVNVLST